MTPAIVCRQCGSMRVRDVAARPLERVIALVLRQRVIACNRCGWRGRAAARSGDKSPSLDRRRRRHHHEAPTTAPAIHAEIDLTQVDEALNNSSKR